MIHYICVCGVLISNKFFFPNEIGEKAIKDGLTTLDPYERENEKAIGNATKNMIVSGPFFKSMCLKISIARHFQKSIPTLKEG